MLRVDLRIDPEVTPELHAALTALPPRRRAERLRALALMGMARDGRVERVEPAGAAAPAPAAEPTAAFEPVLPPALLGLDGD